MALYTCSTADRSYIMMMLMTYVTVCDYDEDDHDGGHDGDHKCEDETDRV